MQTFKFFKIFPAPFSISVCAFLFCISTLSASAFADPISTKDTAELKSLFDQGKYDLVLETLRTQGMKSAGDYYNAGLAASKSGFLELAYAYFLKASSLDPESSDIRYNLSIAEEDLKKTGNLLKDKSWTRGIAIPVTRNISIELLSLALTLLSLLVVGTGFLQRSKGRSFFVWVRHWSFWLTFSPWVLTVLMASSVAYLQSIPLGVVVSQKSPISAYSGPAQDFTELFTLPTGTQVELTGEKRGDWVQIRFSLGNVGWIMEKDVLRL